METSDKVWQVPLVIRGKVYTDPETTHPARRGSVTLACPDAARRMDELACDRPSELSDLYSLTFDDILDYLAALTPRLSLDTNPYIQEAFELASLTCGVSASILRHHYGLLPQAFEPSVVREAAEGHVGIDYLEGWVEQPGGRGVRIRAFGARCVHVVPGNVPNVSAGTIVRNAITRSDAIIKAPSNDPLTATAIARTMVEMDPEHPLTKHLSVAYWKGGNAEVEDRLYHPRRVEKIVAWGGLSSVTHIKKYLQPGIDLITLDPKSSASIIGAGAFESPDTMQEAAHRLAIDVGAMNQEGCVNSRIAYVETGTDAEGLSLANTLGEAVFEAIQKLPTHLSTVHDDFDPELKEEIDALSLMPEDYRVFGGRSNEGAVIVSQDDVPVDFLRLLACRVLNIVPVDKAETALASLSSWTQTVGVYPEDFRDEVRDRMVFQGVQRVVSLGAAATLDNTSGPQDGIEPVRRMVKWIVDEVSPPGRIEGMLLP